LEWANAMTTHSVRLFADYHQFYVWDAGTDPCAPEDYSDEAGSRRVTAVAHVLVVHPIRNTAVPVDVELCESEPPFEQARWDHAVDCSLHLPTGSLQVHECTGGPVLDLVVEPGSYRARVLFGGLNTVSEDGLQGDDCYRVVLWPGPPGPLLVLKEWNAGGRA